MSRSKLQDAEPRLKKWSVQCAGQESKNYFARPVEPDRLIFNPEVMRYDSGMTSRSHHPSEHPECRYCSGFLSPDASAKELPWNTPVIESSNFVVVPTLGHFIPGWLLLIPRLHYPCLGALDPDQLSELMEVKARSEALLKSLYGAVIKFEHGPCSPGTAGSCVSHAHLHLVPTWKDFHSELCTNFTGRRIGDLFELSSEYRNGSPYLFYEDDTGLASVYQAPLIPSQYMRMLIARHIGRLDQYDWRDYPGESEITIFLQELQKAQLRRVVNELLATG